ncbi:MAG: iron ABC transporter permease [Chloroflexi bacterium]|nr:MAG: iron ABC transporter permease [Chloroflexota bacterium]
MAGTLDGILGSRRADGRDVTALSMRLLSTSLPLLVGVVLALPLAMLLTNSFNVSAAGQPARFGFANWQAAVADPSAVGALWNSFALAIVRTAISLPVALVLTCLVARTDMPGRGVIELLAWLSIFVPVLPLAFGWVLILDAKFGLLNALISSITGSRTAVFDIYGFWGITWVHLASTSVAYKVVLLAPAFRRIGVSTEQAARVCGASAWQALTRVTLPLLAPSVLLVTVISLVLSFESFEVELLLGAPVHLYVYSTRIYDLVNNQPSNVGEATAMAVVFLVWLLLLTWLYRRAIGGRSYTTVTGRDYASRPILLGRWGWVALGMCLTYFTLAIAAPLAMLVAGSFMRLYGFFNVPNPYTAVHWQELFADPAFRSGAANSLIVATTASLVTIVVYSMLAYAVTRYRSPVLRAVDMLAWSPWAVPGVLMSLALLWLFLATPLRSVLYGSVAGLAAAFVFRAAPISTQFFKTSLMQIGPEVEEVARTCGAAWLRMYWRVVVPMLAPTAVTVGLITFLSAIYDISTPVLLYSASSRPLSILMLEYGFAGARERGAAIGVVLTIVVLLILLASRRFGYRLSRERL